MFKVTFFHFLHRQFSITILIKCLEHLCKTITLTLVEQLTCNESIGGLFHCSVCTKTLQVIKSTHCLSFVHSDTWQVYDPIMLEHFLGRWTLLLLVGEEFCDEIFALVWDLVPSLIIKSESPSSYLFHDFLIALTIEWRDSTEKNVANNTTTPYVAFSSVVLVENFWCDVVRGPELFIELLVWIIDKRSPEVNDLDLVELFVLL